MLCIWVHTRVGRVSGIAGASKIPHTNTSKRYKRCGIPNTPFRRSLQVSPRTHIPTLHAQNLHRKHGARDVRCQSGRLNISHVGFAYQVYSCHRDRATGSRRQLYRHLALVMLPDRARREKYRTSGCLACAPDSLRCPFAPRPLHLSIQTFLDCEGPIGARAGDAAHGQGAGAPSWRVRPRVGSCPVASRFQQTSAVRPRRTLDVWSAPSQPRPAPEISFWRPAAVHRDRGGSAAQLARKRIRAYLFILRSSLLAARMGGDGPHSPPFTPERFPDPVGTPSAQVSSVCGDRSAMPERWRPAVICDGGLPKFHRPHYST